MILLIDNYDSFVYNLARYVRELGETPLVRRHDAMTVDEILALAPSHIIISPGPCSPEEAGISTEVVRRVGPTIPMLGVCLGHQCIGAAYGGEIVRAGRPMHGKTSRIHHRGTGLFTGLPNPFLATRYHSLVISPARCRRSWRSPPPRRTARSWRCSTPSIRCTGSSSTPSRCSPSTATGCSTTSCTACPPPRVSCRPAADDALVALPRRERLARLRPATGGSGPVIIETIVTSLDADGAINFAPMGVEWGEDSLVLKPFLETTTFRNVSASRTAVVNLTDDVMLFAQAAISSPQFPSFPAEVVRGAVLEAACSWRELEVVTIDATPPRSRIEARVVHRGRQREFIGFNRARHAVLEAAILATRTHLLPAEQIREEFARLQVIVDKTAGPREQEAMALLTEYVRSR